MSHDNPLQQRELLPEVSDKYGQLKRRYYQDDVFRALVDMYRNIALEPEVAAHWMAEFDLAEYADADGKFMPICAGYDDRELSYLSKRGVSML